VTRFAEKVAAVYHGTAGSLYNVTQTVQLSGNEMLNRKKVLSSRRKVR